MRALPRRLLPVQCMKPPYLQQACSTTAPERQGRRMLQDGATQNILQAIARELAKSLYRGNAISHCCLH